MYFGNRLVVSAGAGPVVTDRLGSVRVGGGAQPMTYLPYGVEQTSTPNGQIKFGTYLRDGNSSTLGADYADQRYYNPWFGRFNTADPAGLGAVSLSNPTSWNRYAYAGDDPANSNDPSGLTDVAIAGITDSQSANSIDEFAGEIGAITVFPFAGGTIPSGAAGVAGSLTATVQAAIVAQAIMAAAEDSSDDINIFAFSGGAAAFSNALSLLPASVVSRINNVTYASPGTFLATLPVVNGKAPEVILGTGFDDNAARLLTRYPAGTTFIQTECDHAASCEFSSAGAKSRAGSFCHQCSTFSAPDVSLIEQAIAAAKAAAYAAIWGTGSIAGGANSLDYLQLLLQPLEVVTSTVHY